jgi:hypothetical protein
MRNHGCVLAVAIGLLVLGQARPAVADEPEAFSIGDSRIPESSGLAASSTHRGVYWTHNDSGYEQANVYAVDSATGKTVATITLTGVEGRDLEAISIGPDGDIYVGDIGDNLGGSWPEVWIYRFPEPERLRDRTLRPTVHTVRYADSPRDAESLAVHPTTGRVYIVGKNEDGDGLYAGPEELSTSTVNTFERVAVIDLWATDAAFSPDGTRLAVRGYFGGIMYAWQNGKPKRLGRLSVPIQRQGESMTFTPDGRTLMLGTEGEGGEVEPVELSGDQLPENLAETDSDEGSGSSSGSDDDTGSADSEKDGNMVLGTVALAVAVAVWMGLRRLFRRRA